MLKIRFKGNEYVLVGTFEEGGAISTEEQYINGRCSYAHLYEDGSISRFGERIGGKEDIEVIGEVNLKFTEEAMTALIFTGGFTDD